MANGEAQEQHRERQDHFSRLMFGSFPSRTTGEREDQGSEAEPPLLPNIDFMKLFENVNTLADSLQQLKPLVKKITSLVDLLKK
ncbi:hypothetical protein NSQ51_04030 [Geobacillus sp. FSL K6-0789]|uniref:Uncharacterized protein n=2 Tax=Geobacillus stearothermophilus TaxID=1422 RepID=A0A0K9HT60_GEOSE|nr:MULTISPECIES: hypothetical protein [Geobacillus]KAF6510938.1 hypothetical protein GS8_1609 [Geobacillus stearothermophilus]KMY61969.1 hypothetical protein AA906_02920 [Geobacillus stearothermophilus]KMY62060.1 hypothetical protein AA905_07535 [Geobacillus stearothermophilus]KMY62088.1 hypothetical protein AA904_06435 [Geobacillus stearothermophilus]KOR95764.1 hypothetical protein N231_00695 [Geobacillus stearothermophilus ATCC 12980]